ncbi:MAG: tetratricopeptide repeat protein [Acidobacteria bacterium]|nr:tetratricopeptide repeat protein [Acidobacteriota bacterium]
MASLTNHLYEFGPFRLDPARRLLFHENEVVPLTPKAFDTLIALVEHGGQVLEKEELIRRVWPDTVVEENNLNQCISTLRKALGDSPNEHRYIVTLPGRGYRFAASVRTVGVEETAATAPPGVQRRAFTRTVIVTALIGAVATAAYLWTLKQAGRSGAELPVRSLAVLPFKSLAADGGDEYLGLGISDALITRLSNLRRLIIRPTSAVVRYAEGSQDPIAAGRELKVDSVLDGKIQRSGDRIRVTVQLLRVEGGVPLWADQFDQRFADIFDVQDSISERVTGALMVRLSGEEKKRAARRHTANTEAYHAYMKGRFYWSRNTPEDLEKAIESFQQAIRLDPKYALAYAGLADCYVFGRGQAGSRRAMPLRERFPIAKAAVTKALELDDTLSEAYAPLAYLKLSYEWDWAGAEKDFLRAIEFSPGYATAHQWYAECLVYLGRLDEALAAIERARELDPFSPAINDSMVRILYYSRRYDRALEECRNTLELHPNFDQAHILLGRVYVQKKMFSEAVAEFQKAVALSDGLPGAIAWLGHAYAVSGRKQDALRVLQDLKDLSKRRHVSPFLIAIVYAGLDDREAALAWLEKAYDDREAALRAIKVDPNLDNLRAEARFQDLLRRVGLRP